MSGEASHEIDTELTKQHHNYYGEEADPELARVLAANKDKPIGEPAPANASNSDDESIDLIVTATEAKNTGEASHEIDTELTKQHHDYYGEEADPELARMMAAKTLPAISEENIEIVNGESTGTIIEVDVEEESMNDTINETAQTPSSIRISRRQNNICSPLSAGHQSTCSQSARSHDVSVENVPYERLEDDRTTSIPKQPSLRVFCGISEEATFENGEDSDGETGPFLDAVEDEEEKDNGYNEEPLQVLETETETEINNTLPEFTSDELKKKTVKDLKELLKERKLKLYGNKDTLIARLMEPPPPSLRDDEAVTPEGFPATTRWFTLQPKAEPVNF